MPLFYDYDQLFSLRQYPSGETRLLFGENYNKASAQHIISAMKTEGHVITAAHVRTWADLMNVIVAEGILRHLHPGSRANRTWFIPFLPFARDDRRDAPEQGNELQLAIELLRTRLPNVAILDPHSDVAGQLAHIPQRSVVNLYRLKGWIKPETVIVVPDQGAIKKAQTWLGEQPYVIGDKSRSTEDGTLTLRGLLPGSVEPGALADAWVAFVDDICDGAGTFLGLAEFVKEYRPRRMDLLTTHGLYTKGTEGLRAVFNNIGTLTPGPHVTSGVARATYRELFDIAEFV